MTRTSVGLSHCVCLWVLLAVECTAPTPIIQPGAPGDPARELSADQSIEIAESRYSPDDVRFVHDMILHHHQALEMAVLVADRTNRMELIDIAGRINASRGDEIELMQQWLRDRGQHVPDPTAHDAMHTSHKMAGMARPEQRAKLVASDGTEFDRLFLDRVIPHHEGAVRTVKELIDRPRWAYDPVLFEFISEITNGQTAKIERMSVLLARLSADPCSGLSAGFRDACQTRLNLALVASLPKPDGCGHSPSPLAQAVDVHAPIS